jgi:hypothetical protein
MTRRLALFALTLSASVFGADPMAGTWKLNHARSKFSADMPAPKESTMVIKEADGGIAVTVTNVNAQGQNSKVQYTVKYDGKDYPLTGSPLADTVSLKKIDANTNEGVAKKGGKITVRTRTVISKDGKTRTTTWRTTNEQGKEVTWVTVYDRQ